MPLIMMIFSLAKPCADDMDDQEAFEENVSKKLDDFVVKQKRQRDEKRLGNELKLVSANLGKAKINLNKIESRLKE